MEWINLFQIALTALFSGSLVALININQLHKQEKLKTEKLKQDLSKQFIDDYNETIILPVKNDIKRLSKEISILKDAIKMHRYCKYEGPCIIIKKMDSDLIESSNELEKL